MRIAGQDTADLARKRVLQQEAWKEEGRLNDLHAQAQRGDIDCAANFEQLASKTG
jgi:hypothetical protein